MNDSTKKDDNRITMTYPEGVVQKPGIGSHSYNVEEFKTMNTLKMYETIDKAHGIKKELKNDGVSRYFLITDGRLIKYNKEKRSIKQLDIENKVWHEDKNAVMAFFDKNLSFQELLYFKDYYDDELDLSHQRHK